MSPAPSQPPSTQKDVFKASRISCFKGSLSPNNFFTLFSSCPISLYVLKRFLLPADSNSLITKASCLFVSYIGSFFQYPTSLCSHSERNIFSLLIIWVVKRPVFLNYTLSTTQNYPCYDLFLFVFLIHQ